MYDVLFLGDLFLLQEFVCFEGGRYVLAHTQMNVSGRGVESLKEALA